MGGKEGFSGILGKRWEKVEVLHPVRPYSLPYLVVFRFRYLRYCYSIMDAVLAPFSGQKRVAR